jgi:hypothetical protein
MTTDLKAFGLALVAALALGAAAAPAASATNHTFTSTSANGLTDLTGHSENPTFHVAGSFGCETGTYTGTVEGNDVNEITAHPVYEGNCHVGSLEANVTTDGCDYRLLAETDVNGHADAYLECTDGHQIEIHLPEIGVTLNIPEQGPLTGVHYDNLNTDTEEVFNYEEGAELTVTWTIENQIEYNCSGALCFLVEGGGEGTEGSYTDDVTVTGWEDTGNFSQDGETHEWSGTHGDQVHISVSPGT